MSQELAKVVDTQIHEILVSANWLETGPKIRPEIRRFEAGSGLINRAIGVLSTIPEFNLVSRETFFRECTDKEVSFILGDFEYDAYYFKGVEPGRPNVKREEFYLIKNGAEKISITSFYRDNEPMNCHIMYSNNPPDFIRSTHYGNPQAEEECDRLLAELELASE